MYNEAKKKANERYLAKFLSKTVRIPRDMVEPMENAAKNAGQSVSAYIVGSIAERMEREQQTK